MGQTAAETTGRSMVVVATGWESAVRRWWVITARLAKASRSVSCKSSRGMACLISSVRSGLAVTRLTKAARLAGLKSLISGAVNWWRLVERRVGVRVVDGRVRRRSAVLWVHVVRWRRCPVSLMNVMALLHRIWRFGSILNRIWRCSCARFARLILIHVPSDGPAVSSGSVHRCRRIRLRFLLISRAVTQTSRIAVRLWNRLARFGHPPSTDPRRRALSSTFARLLRLQRRQKVRNAKQYAKRDHF